MKTSHVYIVSYYVHHDAIQWWACRMCGTSVLQLMIMIGLHSCCNIKTPAQGRRSFLELCDHGMHDYIFLLTVAVQTLASVACCCR